MWPSPAIVVGQQSKALGAVAFGLLISSRRLASLSDRSGIVGGPQEQRRDRSQVVLPEDKSASASDYSPETLVLYRMRPTVRGHVSREVGRGASDTAV